MSIYEQLNREHMIYYDPANLRRTYEDFFGTASNLLSGMESQDRVIVVNNGFWVSTDDAEEFTFRPGSGILESEMIKPLNRESLEEFLRGVRVEARPEDRRVTFTTGEAGRRAMEEAIERYIEEQPITPIMNTELIDELINYSPNTITIQPRRTRRNSNAGIWNQLRGQDIANSDSINVVREFETEQEAIAYLDSLSQTTIENEENTDTV